MKKNDWSIILSTAAYSFLFYEQSFGVNFLVFNILLVLLLFINNRTVSSQPAWLATAAGCIISSFFVAWWGTSLPVMANFVSVLALAGFTFKPQSSLLVAAINTWFSLLMAIPVSIFRAMLAPVSTPQQPSGESIFKKAFLLIIPLLVTSVFFFVYRAANPIFEKLTNKINFEFITFGWSVFTAFGFVFMYGIFRQTSVTSLTHADTHAANNLPEISLEQHIASGGEWLLSIANQLRTGVIMFGLLNALLLVVNSLDIFYMWVVNRLPHGVNAADYLHNGTDTLIISILMAIGVILFVFRGYLNFHTGNKWLKYLAYVWIVQNTLLVITTAQRNWLVIESSGLTRKRIGVYTYLLLCLIGLTTTLVKVIGRKSNWFLFRKNSWAFYVIFIASCFFNWDGIIVNYNCQHYKSFQFGYIDRGYQSELGYTCIADLFGYYRAEKKESNPAHAIFTPQVVQNMYNTYYALKAEHDHQSWKSFCISKTQNLQAVTEMIQKGEVETYPVYGK
jgi:hypothetical protein